MTDRLPIYALKPVQQGCDRDRDEPQKAGLPYTTLAENVSPLGFSQKESNWVLYSRPDWYY